MTNLIQTTAPPDAVERVREAQRLRYVDEDARIGRELQAVKERFRAERALLIPADVEAQLREYRETHRPPDPTIVTEEERIRLGNEFRAFATGRGVDVAAVGRMQADFELAAAAVVQPRQTGEAVVSEWSPEDAPSAVNQAWDGWWDVGQFFQTSRPSHTSIWAAQSYLNLPALMGSHVRYRLHDVDGDDFAVLNWTNGYMRLFTMPFTGYLTVDLYLTGHHSYHFIDTDDEYGFSNCKVRASQYAIGEVYWDWSSTYPTSYLNTVTISESWTAQNSNNINETPYLTGPGVHRSVSMKTGIWLPAGHTFAVFAGLRNEGYTKLDDVSATVGVDAAWVLNDMSITPHH